MAGPLPYYIAFYDNDGEVAVMAFVQQKRDGGYREASPEALLAEIHKAGYTATEYIVVDPEDLPEPTTAGWQIVSGRVVSK